MRRSSAGLLGLALVVLLALTFGSLSIKFGAPQKWDAAGFWTLATFASVIELSRRRWKERTFRGSLLVIGLVHITAIWLIFGRGVGAERVPLVVTLPFIWAEVTMILKLVRVREIDREHHAPAG
ncbi:MAG: hypothetical protein WA294_00670 [Acidobacteriaceae bacterium]